MFQIEAAEEKEGENIQEAPERNPPLIPVSYRVGRSTFRWILSALPHENQVIFLMIPDSAVAMHLGGRLQAFGVTVGQWARRDGGYEREQKGRPQFHPRSTLTAPQWADHETRSADDGETRPALPWAPRI